jgi:hypothetical protein
LIFWFWLAAAGERIKLGQAVARVDCAQQLRQPAVAVLLKLLSLLHLQQITQLQLAQVGQVIQQVALN